MKRLLTFLFLVLSLGLVLSLNSYAVQSYSATVVNKKTFHKYIGGGTSKKSASRDAMKQCKKATKKNSNCLSEKEFDRYFKTLKPSNNIKITGSTDMLVEWVEMPKTKKETSKKQEAKIYKAKSYGDKTGKGKNQLFLGVSDNSMDDAIKIALNNCKKIIYGNNICKIYSTTPENAEVFDPNSIAGLIDKAKEEGITKPINSKTGSFSRKEFIDGFCVEKSNVENYIFVTPIKKDTNCINHYIDRVADDGLFEAVFNFNPARSVRLNQTFQIRTNAGEYFTKLEDKILLKGPKKLFTKAEPSQTQKVANKNTNTAFIYLKPTDVINFGFRIEIADLEILFLDNGKCKVDISLFYIFENYNKINNCFWETVEDDEKISVEYDFYGVKRKYIFYKDKVNNVGDILAYRPPKNRPYKIYPLDKSYPMQLALKFNVTSFINNNKTQIAKATTSEKPKKNILYKFCVAKAQQWYWTSITLGKCEDDTEVSIEEFIKVRLTRVTGSEPDNRSVDQRFFEELERLIKEFKVYKISENIVYDTIDKDRLLSSINKNKSKVKVAKVEEPKQEEFKPENKDIDNDAPVIEIAQNITVDSQTYTLKGKVKDKSKLYLEANGRPLKISKRGNFELEGFVVDPDAGDKIKIVAIDQWKNKSEKTINIKVEFKEIAELRSYEKPNPSKIKVKQDKNKIAIIIGIEKYKTLKNIDAPYANRDANAFRAYANRALGIPNKNIKVLIDENATRGETLKALTLWLPQIARGKNKDIYVFFAGHGLASDDGKNLYILPQDGDAALLQYTALSRLEIFDLINRVEPNSVTMFFDTCYSGQTRDERMLVAGLRPIRLVAEEQEVQNNFTIFTASNYDQTSGSIEEAKHGIFSYYLMMGMQGKADTNQDKKITNGELIAYLKQNVSEEAFTQNRQQEPMLSGDPDKVLISYR